MVIYSHNDLVICFTFSSSLKGATSDWFYSLPLRSLHKFSAVTDAFLNQNASCQEANSNNYYLLSARMRQGDSLQLYINFFQRQLTKVSNCGKEVFVLAFINGLHVTHPLYKAPPEARRQDERGHFPSSALHPARRGDEGLLQSLPEVEV